jgi:ATP-dependent RNA helicase SUPV3L1/SUV3
MGARHRKTPQRRTKRPSRSERHAARSGRKPVAELNVALPSRRVEPESVVAHLGPTNSGKTHEALAFLAETGRGVYAAPLRMLAQEAHRRLGRQVGEELVGLVTGEERINEHAPIICCTAEMAPLHGHVLVLDEVQWADDEERGSAWTRLLLGAEYRHILLLGALEALPLVAKAFPTATIRFFERKAPLDWIGGRSIDGLRNGSVVVAFSRKAVLALAGEVNARHPDRVAVLYGAMPLASRREEIDRFIGGAAEICVATDVLGHGVNLPCETLLFAETTKFDGDARRELLPWEIAQIAGRAGRYGLVEKGHVGVLTGIPWAKPDPARVRAALTPTVELPSGHFGYRIVDTGRLRPQLTDLNVTKPNELAPALRSWRDAALSYWGAESWLTVESIAPLLQRLDTVLESLREHRRRLDVATVWRLVNAPIDEDDDYLLGLMAAAIAGDSASRQALGWLLDTTRLAGATLEDAEQAGREAGILRWFGLQFSGVGGVTLERAAALEQAAAAAVIEHLRAEVAKPTIGRCRSCGASVAPWATLCDRCFMSRGYRERRR